MRGETVKVLATRPIGIVIPTHNRCAALLECLAHLENQTFRDFEVIIVDDGSTDDTAEKLESYRVHSPLSIQSIYEENSGPAKARNRAVSLLKSPLCLMIGDDIFASPTLVQRHVEAHEKDTDIRVAGLGLTRWSTRGQKVTRFMKWLDETNIQFAYPLLLSGRKPDWQHFYTSNLSVKTELLRRFPFNEAFPYAAMEDVELAYRINQSLGLEMKFLPDAIAEHLHPTTFLQSCARMVRAGYSAGLFYDLWPEQRPPASRGVRQAIVEAVSRKRRLLQLMTRAVGLFADRLCPRHFVPYLLFAHFEVGLQSRVQNQKPLVASPTR